MIQLYHNPRSRSIRPLLVLEELGVPYEIIPVSLEASEHKSPECLKVNPLGQLPALVDGGRTILESVAICLYLADKFFDKGLARPVDSPERGPYLQWCVYNVGTLEVGPMEAFREKSAGGGAESGGALRRALDVLADALGDRDTLLASGFSTADALTASSLLWMRMKGVPLSDQLARYADLHARRPSFLKTFGPPSS